MFIDFFWLVVGRYRIRSILLPVPSSNGLRSDISLSSSSLIPCALDVWHLLQAAKEKVVNRLRIMNVATTYMTWAAHREHIL